MAGKKSAIWIFVIAGAAAAALMIYFGIRHYRPRWSIIQGAVIQSDADVRKQLPISGALISATYRDSHVSAQSDASGYFKVTFPGAILPGQMVELNVSHPGYKPVQLPVTIRFRSSLRQLVIVAVPPEGDVVSSDTSGPQTAVTNIRVRYTVNSQNEENIGSAVKTFEVENQGNVPCRRQGPCSPDGLWKATSGSIQMDAGAGNQFRDARMSCIAGPCPFTTIQSRFTQNGRIMTASALDWSSTVTFLLQAEVFHTTVVSDARESYPVVFGRGLNFTVPPTAEGVTLVAELNGAEVVFPLGPDLFLSWAACAVRNGVNAENSSVYQCELKPGYRF